MAKVSDIQLLPRLVYIYPTKEESKVDPIKSQACCQYTKSQRFKSFRLLIIQTAVEHIISV